MREEKIFIRPSKEHLTVFVRWFLVVLVSFLAVYYSSNAYATKQTLLYHMYADWELSIPLVPWMIIVYMTYVLIFAVVLFVIKTPEALKNLAYSMLSTIFISGIVFFIFPGYLGYNRPDHVPEFSSLFDFLFTIDQPHNLFPSLHVAFASLCVCAMIHQTTVRWFHVALKVWFIIVCASVILVHQHHLFDVGLGFLLGWVVYKLVYLRGFETAFAKLKEVVTEVT